MQLNGDYDSDFSTVLCDKEGFLVVLVVAPGGRVFPAQGKTPYKPVKPK